MSTIDDLACAKLVASGCENPKGVLRGLKLFGFPEKDLSRYLRAKAWELEEAVAIGLGYHPRNLSESVIREKCPEQIDLQGKPPSEDTIPIVRLFLDRYELLKRGAFIGDIKSEERGEKIWFRLPVLAAWAIAEWDYMPEAARALMAAAVGLDAALPSSVSEHVPAAEHDTRKDEALSSAGVLKAETGKAACVAWIISEIRKSPNKPPFRTQPELREYCMIKFKIKWRPAEDAWQEAKAEWNEANPETCCTWYRRGPKRGPRRAKAPFILAK